MRRSLLVITCLAAIAVARPMAVTTQTAKPAAPPAPAASSAAGPVVVLETNKGIIEFTVTEADAPKSAARILQLARTNFYRGLRFHWVDAGVIQIGDPATRDMTKQEAWGTGGSGRPIGVAEPSKKPFVRGSVGIAYTKDWKAETADSQIFILRNPNPALNGKYAQIGKVIKGMDVVDKIVRLDNVTKVSVR